jgi:lipoate-protein ligase A
MIDGPSRVKLIEYACLAGEANMELDRRLLAACETDPTCGFLRFYTWDRPTLSMGRLEPEDAVARAAADRDGIGIVRRPTGGRAVLHGDDLTYTVVIPKPSSGGLQCTYNLISEVLVEGLRSIGVEVDMERGKTGRSHMVQRPCFASVTRYEVTHSGRKLVGSAQRVGERAVLQHGTIPIGRGYLCVVDYMDVSSGDRDRLRSEMEATTACLEGVLGKPVEAGEVACALSQAFGRRFGCDLEPLAVGEVWAFRSSGRTPGRRANRSQTQATKALDSASPPFI